MPSVTQTELLREAESIAQIGSWMWDLETNRLTGTDELWRIFDLPASDDARIEDTFLTRVHSAVRVYGGYTGSGHFQIAVASTGIRLNGEQARLCIQRGWRSEEAEWVTGEGNGIGLYVVDRAMKAMGGAVGGYPDRRSRYRI